MAREGLNRVTLIGNLGADPELKYTQGGQALLRLRLATTESYANRSGERQERTEWHTVKVWGKRGEALNKFLGKGHTLCIEGRIQYSQWEDDNGNKRNMTDIVATNIVLLGGGRGQGGGGGYGGGQGGGGQGGGYGGGGQGGGGYGNDFAQSNSGPSNFPPADDFGDDDIPF